jgi:hypothetical protein
MWFVYIYETSGFKNLFTRPKARLHAAKVLREIVLGRIAFPGSKRMIVDTLNAQFGVDLKLDQAYNLPP